MLGTPENHLTTTIYLSNQNWPYKDQNGVANSFVAMA